MIMNIRNIKIMGVSVIAAVLMVVGAVLLVLGTLPMENKLENNTLTVKFVVGQKQMDVTGAAFLPVPEDALHNIIRSNGTSVGKKHSGHFKNIKTKSKFIFYLTGHGEKVYFELDGKKYLVDGITPPSVE